MAYTIRTLPAIKFFEASSRDPQTRLSKEGVSYEIGFDSRENPSLTNDVTGQDHDYSRGCDRLVAEVLGSRQTSSSKRDEGGDGNSVNSSRLSVTNWGKFR